MSQKGAARRTQGQARAFNLVRRAIGKKGFVGPVEIDTIIESTLNRDDWNEAIDAGMEFFHKRKGKG